jgi:hypothetical protein
MNEEISDSKMFLFDLPESSPIYSNWDIAVVDSIVDQLQLFIPCMIEGATV